MTLRTLSIAVLALSSLTLAASCGGEAPPPAPAAPPGVPVDAATAGSVSGRVSFTGTPPVPDQLPLRADAACVAAAGGPSMPSDAVLVDPNGGLQNVFIHVKDGLDTKYAFPMPAEPVVLDQAGCRYVPRVVGIRVGQPLDVLNSDDTLHNVHGMPTANVEFNDSTPLKGTKTQRVFTTPEVMVPFKCNVHSWMTAHVGVMAHPFFAVSAADGTFTISGLPPGTYTIEAWHERFGTQTQQVTIADRGAAEASFTFAAPASSN